MALHIRRLFGTPVRWISVRSRGRVVNEPNVEQPHIYKKTYTKEELLKHITDNVIYDSSDYIVTSVPQGTKLLDNDRRRDSDREVVCDVCLKDMIQDFCNAFNSEYIFISKQPGRNSSGLLLLSRNYNAFDIIRDKLKIAANNLTRIYTYLAVVMNCPSKELLKTYMVEEVIDCDAVYTRISRDDGKKNKNRLIKVKTKYNHTIVDSTGQVSLLKINISYDLRDSVRHILARMYFSPVFGDFWNGKRPVNFLLGAPVLADPVYMKEAPCELSPEILEKLHLTPEEQKFIPIHCHLYGLKLSLMDRTDFFASVPPPESFVWTCRQLGLHRIEEFIKCTQISS